MAKISHSKFWITVIAVLSIVFIVLFLPVVLKNGSLLMAILMTLAGVLVIWAVYFIRAYIFSRGNVLHQM